VNRNTLQEKDKKSREKTKLASRVLIITGLSGSGKTVALRAVEDTDFFWWTIFRCLS
jgi:adenylylsulfate kinase-like enzyme